jgi:hypothetical protein
VRYKYLIKFSDLPTNENFSLNGNEYRKRSTRTAEIINPEMFSGTWFYFGKNELVLIKQIIRNIRTLVEAVEPCSF